MPFIETKISVPLTAKKEELIKTKFGQAISLLGKTEDYLMIGFQDQYDLFFAGNKLDKGAYVSVSLFGESSKDAYNKMTETICQILYEELDIPKNKVYVTFHSCYNWGWNGQLF